VTGRRLRAFSVISTLVLTSLVLSHELIYLLGAPGR